MSLANSLIYPVQSRSQLGGVDFVASLAPVFPPKITEWTVCQCNLMTDTRKGLAPSPNRSFWMRVTDLRGAHIGFAYLGDLSDFLPFNHSL